MSYYNGKLYIYIFNCFAVHQKLYNIVSQLYFNKKINFKKAVGNILGGMHESKYRNHIHGLGANLGIK